MLIGIGNSIGDALYDLIDLFLNSSVGIQCIAVVIWVGLDVKSDIFVFIVDELKQGRQFSTD
jgi:hypothetical protein